MTSDNFKEKLSDIKSQLISEKENLQTSLEKVDNCLRILTENDFWDKRKDSLFKDFIFSVKDFYNDIFSYIAHLQEEIQFDKLNQHIEIIRLLTYSSHKINALLDVIWRYGGLKSAYKQYPILEKLYLDLNELNISVQFFNNISYRIEYAIIKEYKFIKENSKKYIPSTKRKYSFQFFYPLIQSFKRLENVLLPK
ncbi:hypothetical protein [Chondrinema litorale]|uniref:hypothetical protein n=1 Tax=Chondrinema litorale TaxID=2994555 RepID=UPI0025428CDB|nr:hypothetical protein [Chondrinema litorale]UZR99574.1 hypothetical protein OQ292_37565 [Chondrinema litorale]